MAAYIIDVFGVEADSLYIDVDVAGRRSSYNFSDVLKVQCIGHPWRGNREVRRPTSQKFFLLDGSWYSIRLRNRLLIVKLGTNRLV